MKCFPGYFEKHKTKSARKPDTTNFKVFNTSKGEVNITFEEKENEKNVKSQKLRQNFKDLKSNYPEDERANYEIFETESQIDMKEIEIKRFNDSKLYFNKVPRIQDNVSDLSSDDDDYDVFVKPPHHHVIIDCSSVTYIDTFAVKTIYRVNIIFLILRTVFINKTIKF